MEIDEKIQEGLRKQAKLLAHNLDSLITQWDSWRSEEEGRQNVYLRFIERQKAQRKDGNRISILFNNSKTDNP